MEQVSTIPQAEIVALIASYIYVFAVILVGEVLARLVFNGSPAFSRKFVHVGVGMWVVGTVLLFTDWRWAIIPPLSFIVLNYISYRAELFKSVEIADKRNLGTVYFPISFALIIALFWAKPEVVVAGLMPMTWGDAAAGVIGHKWGKHRLQGVPGGKSVEGSAAMLLFSFVSVALVLLAADFGGQALAVAAVVAVVATVVEALTPWGLDNLTVPILSAVLLWFLV